MTLNDGLDRESEESNVHLSTRRNVDLEIAKNLIKESIKEFMTWLEHNQNEAIFKERRLSKAKEIFGERLI